MSKAGIAFCTAALLLTMATAAQAQLPGALTLITPTNGQTAFPGTIVNVTFSGQTFVNVFRRGLPNGQWVLVAKRITTGYPLLLPNSLTDQEIMIRTLDGFNFRTAVVDVVPFGIDNLTLTRQGDVTPDTVFVAGTWVDINWTSTTPAGTLFDVQRRAVNSATWVTIGKNVLPPLSHKLPITDVDLVFRVKTADGLTSSPLLQIEMIPPILEISCTVGTTSPTLPQPADCPDQETNGYNEACFCVIDAKRAGEFVTVFADTDDPTGLFNIYRRGLPNGRFVLTNYATSLPATFRLPFEDTDQEILVATVGGVISDKITQPVDPAIVLTSVTTPAQPGTQVEIIWDAPTLPPGAVVYVQRRGLPDGKWVTVGTTSDSSLLYTLPFAGNDQAFRIVYLGTVISNVLVVDVQ